MKISSRLQILLAILALFLSVTACIFGGSQASRTPAPGQTSAPASLGNQNLTNPAVGLEGLTSYQAVLTVGFNGTEQNAASQWTTTYTLSTDTASGTRLLSVAATGVDPNSSLDGWFGGTYHGMLLSRDGTESSCEAARIDSGSSPASLDVAAFLPLVTGASATGTEVVAGISAQHFTFSQAAVGFPGKATVKGDMWLAASGGYLVKYQLQLQGGSDVFGQGMNGTMTWDYQLNNVNSALQITLPDNCPAGLIDAPAMDGAELLNDEPGLLEFNAAASLADVAAYYEKQLPTLGYTVLFKPSQPPQQFEEETYTKPGLLLTLRIDKVADKSSHVLITLEQGQAAAQGPTPTAEPSTNPQGDAQSRLNKAFGLLFGSKAAPTPLGSYHLELTESLPVADASGKITVSAEQISADVSGADIYMKHTVNQQVQVEGYLKDGKEYTVQNGKAAPSLGTFTIDWVSWRADVITPYTIAAMGPAAKGQDTIDGRSADVFTLDTANVAPSLLTTVQSMTSFTPNSPILTAASGTAWIDQKTGALLKLNLDYTDGLKDAQGNVTQATPGHIELTISKVGAVTVNLP